jgi:hypothetical protein
MTPFITIKDQPYSARGLLLEMTCVIQGFRGFKATQTTNLDFTGQQ